MNDRDLYFRVKNYINQAHQIKMVGLGNREIISYYDLVLEDDQEDATASIGMFKSFYELTGLPTIILYTKHKRSYIYQLFTLIHEYGHFESYCARSIYWQTDPNKRKYWAIEKKKKFIYDEEAKAWKNAKKFLQKFISKQDSRWLKFEKEKRYCLNTYK